jgi:hypothetical protein
MQNSRIRATVFRATLGDSLFLGNQSLIKVVNFTTKKAGLQRIVNEISAYTYVQKYRQNCQSDESVVELPMCGR